MNLLQAEAHQIAEWVRTRKVRPQEVAQTFLQQTRHFNQSLGTFISLNQILEKQAEEIERKIKEGKDPGVLAGVPIAIKDVFCTQEMRTTAGSKMLANFIPPYSATVVERLQAAGALILGKTNMDEFAMGSSNENSAFGVCRNPWNLEYVPGGSSGGSAAAVAARMSPLALGSDTGGSIRQPASFCGIVGLKPTYGRVSRYGMIAYASSLDQAGPMGRSIQDVALALEVIAGFDALDGTSASHSVPSYQKNLEIVEVEKYRIGIPRQFFQSGGLDQEIAEVIEKTIKMLEGEGFKTVDIDLNLSSAAVSTYYLIATSEASSNLARYDGVRFGHRADFTTKPPEDLFDFYSRSRSEGFGEEVKRRILLGSYVLSAGFYEAYYKKASQVRRLIRNEFKEAFELCDVIIGPVTATLPFRLGERINDPLKMYLNDAYTVSANLAGIPAMSVPGQMSREGFPIGVQLMAAPFKEEILLQVGRVIEKFVGLKERCPDVSV